MVITVWHCNKRKQNNWVTGVWLFWWRCNILQNTLLSILFTQINSLITAANCRIFNRNEFIITALFSDLLNNLEIVPLHYCFMRWPSCKCKDNLRWLRHEHSLTTSLSLMELCTCSRAESFLHQTIWKGNFAVCITYGSVCHCSSQDQSPAVIQHSWFFCCASLLYHFQFCCKKPRSLLYYLTFSVWVSNQHWGLSNQRPQVGDDPSLPLCCTRCLCPWKPTMSPTLKLVKVCLFLKPSGSAQH